MAWIEKRSSGYLVRWRDGQGKKHQRLVYDESSAHRLARSLRSEPRRAPRPTGVTLAGYLDATLRAADDLRESTRYHYALMARKHIAPLIGHLPLTQVTSADVREVLATMREAGYSSSYRSIARNVLARTCALAVSEGLLPQNPLAAVPILKQPARPEVMPLDVREVEALADAILPRYRAAVLVMAYAGLRVGEVGALSTQNLNLLRQELRVVSGVSRAGGRLLIGPPKTAAGRRTVPLPQFLARELREHIDAFGLAPDGRVFHTPHVNQHTDEFGLLHASSLHKPFKAARELVGLPHVHPHTLRHSYAAFLIREGAHEKVLQVLMGHTSIKTTMDLYGHLLPGLGQEMADRLESARRVAFGRCGLPESGRHV